MLSDEQKIALLKRQWGAETKLMVAVPLLPLMRFVGTSYEAIGVLKTFAMMSGESGQTLRLETERLQRTLNMNLEDLTN